MSKLGSGLTSSMGKKVYVRGVRLGRRSFLLRKTCTLLGLCARATSKRCYFAQSLHKFDRVVHRVRISRRKGV